MFFFPQVGSMMNKDLSYFSEQKTREKTRKKLKILWNRM